MVHKKVAPYGSWISPITSNLIVSESIGLTPCFVDDEAIFWLESRPSERGRAVIVKHLENGTVMDVNPPPYNVRTRVHEYGGGAFCLHNAVIYFSNFTDQRLYQVAIGDEPSPITPDTPMRYADCTPDELRHRLICVREDHRKASTQLNHNEAVNSLAAIYLDGSEKQEILTSGNDFYANPRINPSGTQLAWLTWCHPNMPWDGTELWLADIQDDGQLTNARRVAGGPRESIFQPEWSPDGILTFVSDRTGWWNLYRLSQYDNVTVKCLLETEAEFGLPQWSFGMSTYAYLSSTQLACMYTRDGNDYLGIIDVETGELKNIDLPYTSLSSIMAHRNKIVFRGAAANLPGSVIVYDVPSKSYQILKTSHSTHIDAAYLSIPEPITFPTTENMNAFALYYSPQNPDFVAPENEKPPLIVISHGGPTSAAKSALNLQIQYWTSRGFAVLDVNYGGSTGYGRQYRERLNRSWGIVDVNDCANGALYLAKQGYVDKNRLAIKGGSAGGYTTLSALAFKNVFHAGVSYFGVSDLEALALDTHKFESRYLDNLIGPYPQCKDIYIDRSPIHHIAGLNCPMIFFQGSEDRVVPPDQAEKMVAALKAKGIPVAFIMFEGEQHGFRQASSIKRALDAELYFYSRIFDFTPADSLEPIDIHNL